MQVRLIIGTVLATVALLLSGCAPEASAVNVRTQPTREVRFAEVQSIFTTRCIACHAPGAYEDGTAMGGLVLSAGKSGPQLINVKSIESPLVRVAPGNLQKSYMYHKLRGTFTNVGGTGVQMPLGSPPLPETEITVIEDWILSGARLD